MIKGQACGTTGSEGIELKEKGLSMAEPKVLMTPEGHARLREELRQLTSIELPQVIQAIGAARERGDLSENAEYHAAQERKGFIVARVAHIEETLSRAEVIDPATQSGSTIQFGARVKLMDTDTGEESAYQIVGPEESDNKQGRISVTSPLARALLGREVGDEVRAMLPNGSRTFEVIDLVYG
jgi:transcription elongation factor GreA